ncbi:MAG: M67 family metallopeptidase [Chloroflexi bacterium]|nr:M67 family metallopeptidase [Chloroflexota bacterium]
MTTIPRSLAEALIAHAREELPNEACGLVHELPGGGLEPHRVTNVARSPYRYEMDGLEQMRLEEAREARGERLFAIYHSHVATEGRPSPTDVRMAFFPPGAVDSEPMYPEALYVLVSLAQEPPPVRAFRIRRGGEVAEEPVEVAEGR